MDLCFFRNNAIAANPRIGNKSIWWKLWTVKLEKKIKAHLCRSTKKERNHLVISTLA